MTTDKKAIVKVYDSSCIDVFVEHDVYMELLKLGRVNYDGVAFRSKRLYPND